MNEGVNVDTDDIDMIVDTLSHTVSGLIDE